MGYLEHMQQKTPHERRQHAVQVAGGVTALVFVAWITTLGLRLGGTAPSTPVVANATPVSQNNQLASVITGFPSEITQAFQTQWDELYPHKPSNTLEVASDTQQ